MKYRLDRSSLVLFVALIAGLCLGAVLSLDAAKLDRTKLDRGRLASAPPAAVSR